MTRPSRIIRVVCRLFKNSLHFLFRASLFGKEERFRSRSLSLARLRLMFRTDRPAARPSEDPLMELPVETYLWQAGKLASKHLEALHCFPVTVEKGTTSFSSEIMTCRAANIADRKEWPQSHFIFDLPKFLPRNKQQWKNIMLVNRACPARELRFVCEHHSLRCRG